MIFVLKRNSFYTAYVILEDKLRILSQGTDCDFVYSRVQKYVSDPGSYTFRYKEILNDVKFIEVS